MRSVGFRAEKDRLTWAIVEGTVASPVRVADDNYSAPKSFSEADALAWYRERVQTLIDTYSPKSAAIRVAETFLRSKPSPSSLSSMFARARLEGVVIEAAVSKGMGIMIGRLQQISSGMGSKSAKGYIGSTEVRGIDLADVPKYRHEAVLAAISVLGK